MSFQAHYQAGLQALQTGDFLAALDAFQACLQLNPAAASVCIQLGGIYVALEQYATAIPFYLQALEQEPENESLYLSLADCLYSQGDFDMVLECLKSLCLMYPQRVGMVSFYMGFLLEKQGDFAAALYCYDQALAQVPLLEWGLKRELAFPMLMASRTEIEACARRLEQVLDQYLLRLRLQGPAGATAHQALKMSAFDAIALNLAHLAYHHYPLLPLRRKMGQLMRLLLPAVPLTAPSLRSSGPIHLGVIFSAQLTLALTYLGGLLNHLPDEDFRITLFCPSAKIQLAFDPSHPAHLTHPRLEVCLLSADYREAAQQVHAAGLDAFFLAEPNWDTLQYKLSLQRLAPVQFTSWINPGTTGVPTMDYYLSTSLMESPASQRYYSEKLVLFETVPVCFPAPVLPPRTLQLADFGLPPESHLYLCPNNMLKFHPDFDALIEGILTADPAGQLILTTFKGQDNLAHLLLQRFQQQIPHVMDRIWVLPQLEQPVFFQLLALARVLLDPLYYGGGTISYQAFASGLPVVTLPGEQLLSRVTLGYYHKMAADFESCIARDAADYIAKAVRLGTDPLWHQQVAQQILAQAPRLFDDLEACQAFAAFLQQVCRPSLDYSH